jgi:two-component system, NarL family, invasion response regulator UvrY
LKVKSGKEQKFSFQYLTKMQESQNNNKTIKVALADDHILLRSALASLINEFGICKVIHESKNGNELISYLKNGCIPDVAIVDLNMPEMDGYETAKFIKNNYEDIHVLMLTMYDAELSLIRLLQAGVKGFLKKDIHPSELKFAIQSVYQEGYYYSNHTAGKLVNLFRKGNDTRTVLQNTILSEQEIGFLKLVCTDLTYKEVAQSMKLNPRTIDNLRDQLFIKLDVKSRVGLAMVAIRNGIVNF